MALADPLWEDVARVLAGHPGVRAAVAFGSRVWLSPALAQGSDYDVLAVVDEGDACPVLPPPDGCAGGGAAGGGDWLGA